MAAHDREFIPWPREPAGVDRLIHRGSRTGAHVRRLQALDLALDTLHS